MVLHVAFSSSVVALSCNSENITTSTHRLQMWHNLYITDRTEESDMTVVFMGFDRIIWLPNLVTQDIQLHPNLTKNNMRHSESSKRKRQRIRLWQLEVS